MFYRVGGVKKPGNYRQLLFSLDRVCFMKKCRLGGMTEGAFNLVSSKENKRTIK